MWRLAGDFRCIIISGAECPAESITTYGDRRLGEEDVLNLTLGFTPKPEGWAEE
jgi:hypothetical protein